MATEKLGVGAVEIICYSAGDGKVSESNGRFTSAAGLGGCYLWPMTAWRRPVIEARPRRLFGQERAVTARTSFDVCHIFSYILLVLRA